jgi:flagellar biogenesis protein FliO
MSFRIIVLVCVFVSVICFGIEAGEERYVSNDGNYEDATTGEKPEGENKSSASSKKELKTEEKKSDKDNPLIPITRQKFTVANMPDKVASEDVGFMPSLPKIISMAGLMLFLVGLAVYLKFKKSPSFKSMAGGQRQLQLLSDLTLPNATLSLVQMGEKIYLIGSNDHTVNCLDQIIDPEEKDRLLNSFETVEESGGAFRNEYNDMLQQMNQGYPAEMEESSAPDGPEVLVDELDSLKQRLKELA